MSGKICVAEVEEMLQPDHWILIIFIFRAFMHRLIQGEHEKRIEQRTTRPAA